MNPDSENFEQLRRLLALKRHEQPPPGYFNRFSGEVIARIRAGEGRESAALDGTSWVQRLWTLLQGKPAVVGAFGAAVCGLLVAGVLQAERGVPDGSAAVAVNTPSSFAASMPTPAVGDSLAGIPVLVVASNSAPVASTEGSLFDQVQLPSATPVSSLDRFILPNQLPPQ
jgi:hypothetical protein